ncbi:hypothetical protein [Streptomyces sp. NPDC005209]|uniref:hypothetical protein n=1 Tax=Streptomyces sp. NPDC005209 TaxID=3156715 RepID=UPI0033B84543
MAKNSRPVTTRCWYWPPCDPNTGTPDDPHGIGHRHAHASELLDGHEIDVPDAFSPTNLAALDTTSTRTDPPLAQAANRAQDGQVTQTWPECLLPVAVRPR